MPKQQHPKQAKQQLKKKKNKEAVSQRNSKNLIYARLFAPPVDLDDNGIVDGSETTAYQLYKARKALLIASKSGRTYSNRTSRKWSALAAAQTKKGHLILINNNQSRQNKYRIWTTNRKGIIRNKGRWQFSPSLSSKGYEKFFGIDFNNDGIIEGRKLIDAGDGKYVITGTAAVGEVLKVKRKANDPDGNGKHFITWQSSLDKTTWTTIKTRRNLRVPRSLEGVQIRAQIEYKDGDGFEETVYTQPVATPIVDDGEAAFLIEGTPAIGQSLSINRSVNDPDGDGTPSISWLQSTDGINWSFASSSSIFTIDHSLEGQRVTAIVDYTDGQGFEESINTDARTIPYVDDGDAAFMIQGTPEVGQTLSISRSVDDLDGDATPSISWLQSTNGVIWFLTSTDNTFTIDHSLEGQRVTAIVDYTDGQGFDESINTDARTIPYVDDGDAAFLIQGTPAIGQTLSIGRFVDDPDGDGAVDISWQASLDGISWWDVSTSAQLQVTSRITGHQLNALVQYTDEQGFKESITTESITIPGTPGFNPGSEDDYSESSATSGFLTVNATASGELENIGDHDWFAVDLTAGVRYQFELNGTSLEDPVLYLRDESSRLIDYNDDQSLFELDSQISFTAEKTGTHYLDVGSYEDAYTGGYNLGATELRAPDPGFNSGDGYGHVNAQRAFEQLLGISLNSVDALGDNLWGLDNVNAPEVWSGSDNFSGVTGKGTTIAVIDTGVDFDHPEFSERIVGGYDFVDGDSIADDGNGHGTHVAGTIAAANDGNGTTGVAYDADIMPLRVLNNDGYGWTSDIISAVRWAADNGADVINLSLGGEGYSLAMADAISYASSRGSVVVMAAGNFGGSSPDYPAAHAINHGIAVGAVDRNRALAGFSNRAGATELDYVTAPGVNVYSAVPGGGYASFNGTSMAAPHVAGVAGLLKSHDRNLSASTIEDLLTGSASNTSSRRNVPPSDELRTQDVITLETLNNFQRKELGGTLIASLDGNAKERRSTLRELKEGVRNNDAAFKGLDHVEVIEASRNSFAVLELSDARSVDPRSLLNELLASDQFHYFEVDQKFSIV